MSADAPPPPAPAAKPPAGEFYDAKFSIEAIQHEPYENGFTWRTILGALFISLVMLPGLIFMGLMIGQDLGTAAEWVTIILFVEVARRAFITLRKQELYVLKYTASQLTHIAGGLSLGGGMFAFLVWNRYLRNSEAFASFGIARDVPDWVAPYGEAAYRPFWDSVWWPVITVTLLSALLSKFTQLSLGYMAFKATADMEKLPFPMAPIHAEGAIALAENSQEQNKGKRSYRQYCFALGVMLGAAFGVFYVAVPTLTAAFTGRPLQLLPIPFLDLTVNFESVLPAATIGLSLNLGLAFVGFVLPWRICVGMVASAVLFQILLNPLFYHAGWLPSWQPGKDAIQTHVSNAIDLYLSVGIGTAFAIFFVGVFGIAKAVLKFNRKRDGTAADGLNLADFWRRDRPRGDPPVGLALALWVAASLGYVALANGLINHGAAPGEEFSIWWLVSFAFVWTPINTYINARMSGIAGQHAGVPFVTETAIFLSQYKGVNIWFAPMPIANYGGMADLLKETQLTRTKFTSLLKAELLVFPLLLVASFLFWTYIDSLGPIPSDKYPFVQKFWPQHAQMRALWASSMLEGQSLLWQSVKPMVIVGALAVSLGLFGLFGLTGLSAQYLYGAIGAVQAYPHNALMIFLGALVGRFFLARRFGKEKWTNYAPILAVGFAAGMGLIGMFSIAINFLWTSVGSGS